MKARITVSLDGREHSEVVEGTEAAIQRRVRAIMKRYRNAAVSWREVDDQEASHEGQ